MRFSQKRNRALVQNDFSVRTQVQLCPRPILFWFRGPHLYLFFMSGTCRRLKAPCSGWLILKLPVLRSPFFFFFPLLCFLQIRQLLNKYSHLILCRKKAPQSVTTSAGNSRNRAFGTESRHLGQIALVFVCLFRKRPTHRRYDRRGSAGTWCRVRATHLWRANVLHSKE